MSFSFGSKSTKANTTGQSDPWDVAIPGITDVLNRIQTAGSDAGNVSSTTQSAFDQLITNAGNGNPFAGDISNLATQLFATPDRTGQVGDAYADLSRRLTPVADGLNQDVEENPYVQRMLQSTTDDAMNRVNSMFAGAGRDLSGAHMGATGRAVTNAQLPVLSDLFTHEQGRTDAAARDLYGAASSTATTQAGLDTNRAGLQQAGIGVGQAAIDAENYGPERTIQLEQALKSLPIDELSRLAELLFTAGGLGQQTQGTQKGTQTGFGFGAKLI